MRVFLVVHGFVQGVGYRALVQRAAYRHMVCGYVRNEPDGSVFIGADGGDHALDAFIREIDISIGRIQVFKIEKLRKAPSPSDEFDDKDGFVVR